jgi:tubulin polyglutamylase TTLL6/13
VINVNYTQYEIVKDAADETDFRLTVDDEEDWDIWFIDGPILPTLLLKMKSYQRTNHFPAMYVLARKNLLARNLNTIQKAIPELYDFFPPTWILPSDSKSFSEQFNQKKAKTFIIKPESMCQGRGIFLTRSCDWIIQGEHYVAQRYLHKPYLIDDLKFDLRIYVLITGINPLRCFIFKEGLARFATEEYKSPMGSNLNNLCMHLTNYAINKEAEGFIQNEDENEADVGHKRSLSAIFEHIDKNRTKESDKTSDEVWEDIKKVCVKTVMAGIHPMAHIYKSSKPQDIENSLCHHILGVDIFLDENCKSWLIEVNQSPSFQADSPLDYQIKKNLIRDTFHMLNLSWKRKNKYISTSKHEMANRLVGKQRMGQEERESLKAKKLRIKDKFEQNNMGDYQNLYPLKRGLIRRHDELMDEYDLIYKVTRTVYEETTQGGYVP